MLVGYMLDVKCYVMKLTVACASVASEACSALACEPVSLSRMAGCIGVTSMSSSITRVLLWGST